MKLGVEAYRALVLLSESPEGCTDTVLMAHGFKAGLIAALVQTGLATAHAESMELKGGHQIAVTRLRIADDGLMALASRH